MEAGKISEDIRRLGIGRWGINCRNWENQVKWGQQSMCDGEVRDEDVGGGRGDGM
jgi:hypothetical protein